MTIDVPQYAQMLAEVEKLVSEIGMPGVDLDDTVKKVERGYALIRTMKESLEQTKLKVEELRLKFEEN